MSDGPSDAYKHHYPTGCIVDHTKTPVTNKHIDMIDYSKYNVNITIPSLCDECGVTASVITYVSTGLADPAYRKFCKQCLDTQEYYDKDADCGECDDRDRYDFKPATFDPKGCISAGKITSHGDNCHCESRITVEDPEFTNEIAGIIYPPVSKLTEGTKFDSGKPTTALLPSKPLLEIAKVLDFGAAKYEPHNWRKGIKYSRVVSAAQRHLLAWNDGEQLDPDSKLTHLAHAACNILFLLEYELSGMIEFDDRRKK